MLALRNCRLGLHADFDCGLFVSAIKENIRCLSFHFLCFSDSFDSLALKMRYAINVQPFDICVFLEYVRSSDQSDIRSSRLFL